MTEPPAWGTASSSNDGYVTDRQTAEQIWDQARREMEDRVAEWAERVKVEVHAERAQWLRLVELLEQSKTPARTKEIGELKAYLIGQRESE
jgi:hypothetical protein